MRKIPHVIAFVALVVAAPAVGAGARDCTLRNASYAAPVSHLRLSFAFVGRPHELVSDLALHIVEPRSKKQFWFYFDQGSAPQVSLISTTDATKPNWSPNPDGGVRPYGTATFIGLRKDGRILFDAPSSKTLAPQYIIIPELAALFKAIRLWGVDANAFVFTSCSVG